MRVVNQSSAAKAPFGEDVEANTSIMQTMPIANDADDEKSDMIEGLVERGTEVPWPKTVKDLVCMINPIHMIIAMVLLILVLATVGDTFLYFFFWEEDETLEQMIERFGHYEIIGSTGRNAIAISGVLFLVFHAIHTFWLKRQKTD